MFFPEVKQNKNIDSKHFIKLKDGESVRGILRGDLHVFEQHWIKENGKSHSVECTLQSGECLPCKNNVKSTFRFRINFIIRNPDGSYGVKLFEQGYKVYRELKDLNQETPLETTVVDIKRMGSTQNDTVYLVKRPVEWKVSPATVAAISQIKLHDTKNLAELEDAPTEDNFSDIPF